MRNVHLLGGEGGWRSGCQEGRELWLLGGKEAWLLGGEGGLLLGEKGDLAAMSGGRHGC